MSTHIGECGHPVSDARKKRCRSCYRTRGADLKPDERIQSVGTVCGHPVARPNTALCRSCYLTGRYALSTAAVTADSSDEAALIDALKAGPSTLIDLAGRTKTTPGQVLDRLLALKAKGLNAQQFGELWSLEKIIPISERTFEYVSRPDNTFTFGVASDAHLCSRYAREDVLDDLYNTFQTSGVDRVFNAGNWIDGEDDKNRFDLSVHGLEPQVKYLADRFPKRDGITTYAIWGEDHEGWFARRESIDVGRFAEGHMRQAGRQDWIDLGFVEARVDLINANTGAKASLVVMHPGGGSSYAYSYRPQKIVESLSGGEKPSVLIIGHYHKMSCNIIRNVWTIQAGCTEDQTVFMRKKGLEAHVGGHVVTLAQDPETGAIYRCVSDQRIYYDRRYYNDRWSKTGPVVQAPKYMGGVAAIGSMP